MSNDFVPRREDEEEDVQNHITVAGDEVDNSKTPRSEYPVIQQPDQEGHAQTVQGNDYFNIPLVPSSTHQATGTYAPRSPSLSRDYALPASASDDGVDPSQHNDSGSLQVADRPPPQSNISGSSGRSAETNVTITDLPRRPPARRPGFPDQSFAALHSQEYPRAYVPRTLRQRSSTPGQVFTFASALASTHQTQGSRTVGNSPIVTPGAGLFSPPVPPTRQELWSPEAEGTYASPFLHFTHRQVPKETHVADVDVDPISGRKLINHYEIVDELGRGTHGKVKLGRDLQCEDSYVAIKIVERYSKRRKLGKLGQAEDKVKKEVAILKKARHPNVVALLEVIDDPSRKKVYIVLEWVEKGEIHWRMKSHSKEIALIEARRYERERGGRDDEDAQAEDEAVLIEAQRRLAKKRRAEIRRIRQARREARQDPRAFSTELIGEHDSDGSDDERLSRVSTATTAESTSARVYSDEGRLPSRAQTPLQSPESPPLSPIIEPSSDFLPLTAEPRPIASSTKSRFTVTGLEGTMYGAYNESSGENSRVGSLHSLFDASKLTPNQRAAEVLDSDLNPELEYVPIMTLQQVRVAFRDTLLGLQYLHYQGIVHRDIKPPNLLATSEHRVKISDFGVSYLGRPLHEGEQGEDVSEHEATDLSDEARELAKTVGTPAFYAPELCITDPGVEPLPVTKAIDVWALGITLFCMLFARTPFVDNEFVVMRQIVDEEIYIPRKRLVPCLLKPHSRPTSHSRNYSSVSTGRRNHTELVYEAIDDDLYDLLKRLLTKDPRQRITLEEVRHHPWVMADIANKLKWLAETDPSMQSDGKKIEVSNEDMNTAVVPLQFLDRMRSGIKKVGERIFGGRVRAGSTAGLSNPASPAPSTTSSSTTISQDGRRQSLRGDESIFSALTRSRDGGSSVGSPEMEKSDRLSHSNLRSAISIEDLDNASFPLVSRPLPERSQTIISTEGSVRTVKQTDFRANKLSRPPSPGLPGTPIALESPGGHGLSTILGSGPARRVLKTFRDGQGSTRESMIRSRSTDRSASSVADQHGEPSIAVSQTSVAGHVNPPDSLQEPTTVYGSPTISRPLDHLHPKLAKGSSENLAKSRKSSASSIASSIGRFAAAPFEKLTKSPSRPPSRTAPKSTSEEWQRADDERVRKLIREGDELKGRASPTEYKERPCPPSPDDELMARRELQHPIPIIGSRNTQELGLTNIGEGELNSFPPPMVSSSSDFGSAVSMSISNPSNPSVVSKASSVDPTDSMPRRHIDEQLHDSSDSTIYPPIKLDNEFVDDGYTPDPETNFDSENEDDMSDCSSDSDEFITMGARKPVGRRTHSITSHDGSLATALHPRKSSRSGSNNTMKKIKTRDSEDETRQIEINED